MWSSLVVAGGERLVEPLNQGPLQALVLLPQAFELGAAALFLLVEGENLLFGVCRLLKERML